MVPSSRAWRMAIRSCRWKVIWRCQRPGPHRTRPILNRGHHAIGAASHRPFPHGSHSIFHESMRRVAPTPDASSVPSSAWGRHRSTITPQPIYSAPAGDCGVKYANLSKQWQQEARIVNTIVSEIVYKMFFFQKSIETDCVLLISNHKYLILIMHWRVYELRSAVRGSVMRWRNSLRFDALPALQPPPEVVHPLHHACVCVCICTYIWTCAVNELLNATSHIFI